MTTTRHKCKAQLRYNGIQGRLQGKRVSAWLGQDKGVGYEGLGVRSEGIGPSETKARVGYVDRPGTNHSTTTHYS